MKTISVLANCQGEVLSYYLRCVLSDRGYEIIEIPAVHLISREKQGYYHDLLASCDVLITQPIVDKTRFGPLCTSYLKNSRNFRDTIVIPSIYFDGCFPTYGTIHGFSAALNYVHDFLIASYYLKGVSPRECSEFLIEGEPLDDGFVRHLSYMSIESLKGREESFDVDIKVSNYINDNFRDRRLFYQFNHPTNEVFEYLITQIFGLIGTEVNFDISGGAKKLDGVYAVVYPFVYKALDLKWDATFAVNDKEVYSISDLVRLQYRAYSEKPVEWLQSQIVANKKYLIEKVEFLA